MHGNQCVLKIDVLKYYSVSKRGTTTKSNPKQATDPISLNTKFGDNSSNTFPLNERKPCVTPDIGRRTAEKAKIIYPPPRGVDIIKNNIRDARTPQPGEIVFNTMRYRSSITVQSSRYFQSSVSYFKVQIMLK